MPFDIRLDFLRDEMNRRRDESLSFGGNHSHKEFSLSLSLSLKSQEDFRFFFLSYRTISLRLCCENFREFLRIF